MTANRDWTTYFSTEPSLLVVADSNGIKLICPRREGRSACPLGDKGISHWPWIIGDKVGLVLNHLGLFVAWDCQLANVSDRNLRLLIVQFAEQMAIPADTGFHSRTGDPTNTKVCKRGTLNTRMVIEPVLSMLTIICHLKHQPACRLGHADLQFSGLAGTART